MAQRTEILGDIDRIAGKLDELVQNTRVLEAGAESALRDYVLTVGDFDPKLQEAHAAEWPEELGALPTYVSFPYYKTMRLRSTTSSSYIRRKYEAAARDITGNTAIDILCLTDIIKKEALLIRSFLNEKGEYIGAEAERKVLANFEIWIQSAIPQTRRLHEVLQERASTEYISIAESSASTPAAARRSQAVLKVSLNGLNDFIVAELDSLKRSFSDHARVFYSDFLAPAVEAYGASQGIFSGSSNKLRKEVLEPRETALLGRLTQVIEDQGRRQRVFKDKFRTIMQSMLDRDLTRAKIWSLQETGRSMPTSGDGIMRVQDLSPHEVGFWTNVETDYAPQQDRTSAIAETPDDNALLADHSRLSNLDGDDHPQYLLRSGGEISGKIEMAPGSTIDGLRPSEHRHTGRDGSPQIFGSDIISGTIPEDRIEIQRPDAPDDLRVSNFAQVVVPPGATAIDATLAWEGSDEHTFEVELLRVR